MDDIVWIREEQPAPTITNQSAVANGTIVAEPISTTLSSQADIDDAVEIPVTISTKSTDYPSSQDGIGGSIEIPVTISTKSTDYPSSQDGIGGSIEIPVIVNTKSTDYPSSQDGIDGSVEIPVIVSTKSTDYPSSQDGIDGSVEIPVIVSTKSIDYPSSQDIIDGSVEIPVIITTKPTDYLVSEQSHESAEEKQTSNEQKRVSFNIPESIPSRNEAPSADPSIQKRSDDNAQLTPRMSNEQEGFKITVTYQSSSEDKPADNSHENQPEQPNQNASHGHENRDSVSETSSPGITLPAVDSSVQKQFDSTAQDAAVQSNEPKGFMITVSYPTPSDAKSTESSSVIQFEDQNAPLDHEKRPLVNETSSPVVDSSIYKQPDDKAQETSTHNESKGFKITVSYPGDSVAKSAEDSDVKQAEQQDQMVPKEHDKAKPASEMPTPYSTLPVNDSSNQKQTEDKAQETTIPNESRGFKISVSYPGDSDVKSTENSTVKQAEQQDQKALTEHDKPAAVIETSSAGSILPVADSSIQKQSEDKAQEVTMPNESKGFKITVSYPGDSDAKSTEDTAVKQAEQQDQKALTEHDQLAAGTATSSAGSTLPNAQSSIQKQADDKARKDTDQNSELEGSKITISYPTASSTKSTDDSAVQKPERPDQNTPKELEKPASSISDSALPVPDYSVQKQLSDKVQEATHQINELEGTNATVSSTDSTLPLDGAPIHVEVLDSTGTRLPASTVMPTPVNFFDSAPDVEKGLQISSVDIPVATDVTIPVVKDESVRERKENQFADAKPSEAKAPISVQSDTEKSEDAFDISEYERKLNETTEETKDLVSKLCDTSQKLNQNTQSIANNVAAQRKILFEDVYRTIEDIEQLPPPPELPTGGLPRNVESVVIGDGVLKYVTGCIVLPNGTIVATDEDKGIMLFDIQGNVLKTVANTNWRNPRSPVCHKEHILMLVDMEETKGDWCRYIIKLTLNLEYVARIEGPKWMRNKMIINERLSIAHTDYIYLSVSGEFFSALYELTPVGQWTELQYRHSENYVDMLAFAVIGPITQILAVEGSNGYVLQFSVRESEVVSRRRLAVCERPGAIARDEAGRLFIANRASTSIQLVDTVRWSTARNVALTDSVVPHFSASWGLLAIPIKGAIRLQRYSFRFGHK